MNKICLLLTLFLFGLLVAPAPHQAQAQASETLASDFRIAPQQMTGFTGEAGALRLSAPQGTLLSEVFEPGWEFMAVGVTWDAPLPDDVTPRLDVRVSAGDEQWGEWVPLSLGGEDRPDGGGSTFTELLFIEGRQLQLRATLQNPTGRAFAWDGLKVTAIDGRPGPTAAELHANMAPSDGGPAVITRAQWGANESYRFDSYGNELWPREYWSLRAMFVHHTYSSPSEPDPAAAVRSIYYYHAITNGWGDIGYHYVIDQYGNVYQGRYGTESNGLVVEGGHALGYNNNTMGISLIGNFTYNEPDQVMIDTLESLLVARAQQYGISPLAPVWLDGEGDISPDRWFDHSILGHRDSHNPARTTCPGDALYGLLPEIRAYVDEQVSQPPIVLMASPRDGSVLDGLFTLQADATTNVVRMDYYLDNSLIASSSAAPWSVVVDSSSLPAGNFTLKATGITESGSSSSDERAVTVATMDSPPAPAASPLRGEAQLAAHRPNNPSAPVGSQRVFLPLMHRPPLCEALPIPNGTFESNTEWLMLMGQYAARYTSEETGNGSRSLRVGMAPGDDEVAWSSARLPLTLPADVDSATLTLRYLPQTDNLGGGGRQALGLLDGNGVYTTSLIPMMLYHATEWQTLTYDLRDWIGDSLYLYAGSENVGGNPTRLYVDDIAISICR